MTVIIISFEKFLFNFPAPSSKHIFNLIMQTLCKVEEFKNFSFSDIVYCFVAVGVKFLHNNFLQCRVTFFYLCISGFYFMTWQKIKKTKTKFHGPVLMKRLQCINFRLKIWFWFWKTFNSAWLMIFIHSQLFQLKINISISSTECVSTCFLIVVLFLFVTLLKFMAFFMPMYLS